jgi:hypothetical protein
VITSWLRCREPGVGNFSIYEPPKHTYMVNNLERNHHSNPYLCRLRIYREMTKGWALKQMNEHRAPVLQSADS